LTGAFGAFGALPSAAASMVGPAARPASASVSNVAGVIGLAFGPRMRVKRFGLSISLRRALTNSAPLSGPLPLKPYWLRA
jgi:hypothetical protein